MRILWTVSMSGVSGAVPQAILLCRKLRERGVDASLLHLPSLDVKHKKPYFESEVDGVPIVYPVGNLVKAVGEWQPDLLVCHTFHGSLLLYLKELRKLEIPLVARVGINLIELLVMGLYQLSLPGVIRLLRSMDHIVCAGTNTVKQMMGLGIPESKITWIPTVIDKSKYTVSNCSDPTILIMGRVVPVKNHITMIQAFRLVKNEIPEAELAIVGAGGDLSKILDDVLHEIGFKENIDYKFTGYIQDVNAVFREVSVFCLPSLSENLPQSILEAYACRVPCILSEAGWSEIFEAPLKAWHDSPDEWSECIIRLLKHKYLRKRIVKNQLKELDEKFNLEKALDRYVSLFEEMIRR